MQKLILFATLAGGTFILALHAQAALRIEDPVGTVEWRKESAAAATSEASSSKGPWHRAQSGQALQPPVVIQTGDASSVRVQWQSDTDAETTAPKNQAKHWRVSERSRIHFNTDTSGQVVASSELGQVKSDESSQEKVVVRKPQPYAAAPMLEFDLADEEEAEGTWQPQVAEGRAATKPSNGGLALSPSIQGRRNSSLNGTDEGVSGHTLSDSEILQKIKSQAGLFQRCYLHQLQREGQKGGIAGDIPSTRVLLGITILPTGKASSPKVLQSPVHDARFERCLTEASMRLQFRSFTGANIPVEFPVRIE